MTDAIIRKSIYVAATPEALWPFLTEAEKLGTWFHPAAANLVAGAPFALLTAEGERLCWGDVLEMNPPHRMLWSFTIKPLAGVMTTVEWTIEAVPGGSRLTLVHTGLDATEDGFGLLAALDAGWDAHISKLRAGLSA